MAVEYAELFAPEMEQAFALGSLTGVFTAKYDWTGAKTVKVSTITTLALSDYARTGTARFGTQGDVATTHQHLEVDKERSFTGFVDGLDKGDTMGALNAGAFLRAEVDEKVIPDVDAYVFAALYTACPTGQVSASAAITSANAYTTFLTGNQTLDEAKVPKPGRVCFATPQYLNSIKLDSNYVKASEMAQSQVIFNGQVGAIDGVPVVMVPASIMNATDNHMDFIIVHTAAVARPIKLSYYNVSTNPAGIGYGDLVEGLTVFDCFLLTAKNAGIYIHIHA